MPQSGTEAEQPPAIFPRQHVVLSVEIGDVCDMRPQSLLLAVAQIVRGEFEFAKIARERHLGFIGEALVLEDKYAEFIHALFDFGRLVFGEWLRDVDTGCYATKERARNWIDRTDGQRHRKPPSGRVVPRPVPDGVEMEACCQGCRRGVRAEQSPNCGLPARSGCGMRQLCCVRAWPWCFAFCLVGGRPGAPVLAHPTTSSISGWVYGTIRRRRRPSITRSGAPPA